MNTAPDESSAMNRDINHHHSSSTNGTTGPEQPPPPYSPTSCSHDEESVPSYNPACISDADHPSAPSLYPEIPQQLPVDNQHHRQHQQYQQQQQQQQQLNMPLPMPQPYIQEQAIHHPHSSTPFYHHPHQQGYQQYGTINHNHNNPHLPPPPAGFHTIHLPTQNQPDFFHHHHHPHHRPSEDDLSTGRCFPIGALVFIFGWMCPPL
ncbi:unnamed protein product [Absidia cylindrospora]